MLEFTSILLNSTDGTSRTELSNSFGPLICQKLFVNHDKSSNAKTSCNGQCAYSLPKANVKRKYSMSFVQTQGFKLNVPKLAGEWDVGPNGLWALIARLAKLFAAVKLRDAQMFFGLFEYLK